MGRTVDEFGLGVITVPALLGWAKEDLGSTNAAIRNSAIALMATCHKQLGPGLVAMLKADVKPALMSALEDAFKANPQQQVFFYFQSSNYDRRALCGLPYAVRAYYTCVIAGAPNPGGAKCAAAQGSKKGAGPERGRSGRSACL